MTRRHRLLSLPAAVTVALLMAACGGSSSSGGGVASIASSSRSASSSAGSVKVTEKEAVAYVECMRGEGLDLPDPTVDADGNVTLGAPSPGAGGSLPDPDAFTKAQKVCGEAPEGLIGGLSDVDQTALQDAALSFAKCLRENGVDAQDPDFSSMGAPGEAPGAGGTGGGPFGDLDQDDPKVQAAQKACQSIMAEVMPGAGAQS